MLDYLTLKYIYANEIARFWKRLDEDEDKEERLLWVYREVSFKYHTRTQDMMDAITELKTLFHKAWDHEYEDFRLGIALDKYDLEFQSWLKMQIRLEDILIFIFVLKQLYCFFGTKNSFTHRVL